MGKLLRPVLEKALPKGRFIDQVPVNPDSPQEDEIALASMQPLSFYHGLYFPEHFVRNFNKGIFLKAVASLRLKLGRGRSRTFIKSYRYSKRESSS